MVRTAHLVQPVDDLLHPVNPLECFVCCTNVRCGSSAAVDQPEPCQALDCVELSTVGGPLGDELLEGEGREGIGEGGVGLGLVLVVLLARLGGGGRGAHCERC